VSRAGRSCPRTGNRFAAIGSIVALIAACAGSQDATVTGASASATSTPRATNAPVETVTSRPSASASSNSAGWSSPSVTTTGKPPNSTDDAACGDGHNGECPAGQHCVSCSRPVRNEFFCGRDCRTDADCHEPDKPSCEGAPPPGASFFGFCAERGLLSGHCRSKCAAPDTMIETPSGARTIASLRAGDRVLSVDHDAVVAVPILEVVETPVEHHEAVRLTFASGAVLFMSAGHPLADGRRFGDVAIGARVGDELVIDARTIPYPYDATYDILPDSDTHAYFASGVLVGSTLAR
jgi:hypothetical protein